MTSTAAADELAGLSPFAAPNGLQAALQASPAYGALIAELRRAVNAGFNIVEVLDRAVHQAPLTNTHDGLRG